MAERLSDSPNLNSKKAINNYTFGRSHLLVVKLLCCYGYAMLR
jgi:hypothetical protein